MTNADKYPCSSHSASGNYCTRMKHKDGKHEARTDWGTPPLESWEDVKKQSEDCDEAWHFINGMCVACAMANDDEAAY